jgi:AraC-like DNA-binding protein
MIACLWASISPEDASRDALVLPDACSDLIWEQGAGSYVAGPDTGPARIVTAPGTVIIGARFRAAAGGPALRLPLSEIRDQRVDLADLLPGVRVPAAARQLAAALSADLAPAVALQKVLAVTGALAGEGAPDEAVAYAASLLRDPAARSDEVTAVVGLSERQLRRRFHAAVGYGPKTLQRVYRFRRFVQRVDERGAHERPVGRQREPWDLAAVALEAGYADQAHLTRECVALSGLTPVALARVRG